MTEDSLETRAKVFCRVFVKDLLEAIRAFYLDATKKQKLKGNLAQNNNHVVKILAKGVGAGLGAGAGILCGLFGAFSGVKAGTLMGGTVANMINEKQNHTVSKQINSVFGAQMSLNEAKGALKESLSEVALQIFQNFEWQFMVVSTKEGWSLGMERLASEAVYRVIAYLKTNYSNFDSDSLLKGVLYGESKGILKKGQSLIGINGQDWNTDSFFSKPLVFSSPDVSFEESSASINFDYGFRLPFRFELNDMEHDPEGYDNALHEYVIAGMSEEERNNLKSAIVEELKDTNELIGDLHDNFETLRNEVLKGQEKIQLQLKDMEQTNALRFQEGANRDEITHNLIRQQQFDLKSILRSVHQSPGSGAIHLGRYWPRLMDVSPSIILSENAYNSIVSSINSKLSQDRVLVLNGMRGIGKTTACKWFIAHSNDKYEHILWIDSERTVLESNIKALADKMLISLLLNDGSTLKPYSSLLEEVYEQLQSKTCLFVLANVESPNDIKDCLSYEKTHHFIITTKHHNWTVLNGRNVSKLEIGLPSEEETVEYICKETGQSRLEAKEMAQKLGNLPLAICQSISAIKTLNISIKDYLEEFQAEAEKILQQGSTDSVLTTWSLSVKRLKEQYGQESDLAIQIFNMISFLHSHEIQVSLFQSLGHRKVEVMKSLDMLMSYALIFWKVEGKSITIHNLIQETNRIQINRGDETEKFLEMAIKGMECCIQKEYFTQGYASHLKEIDNFINDSPQLELMISRLKVMEAIQKNNFKEAQILQSNLVFQVEKDPENKLTIIKEKAVLSKISCYFKEHMSALRGLQECFKSLKDDFGELDKNTLELQLLLGLEELHEYLVKKKNFRARKTLEGLIPKLINHPDFGITSPLTLLAKFSLGTTNLVHGEDLIGCKMLEEFNLERQALSEFKPFLGSPIPKLPDDMMDWLSKWYQSLILWNLSNKGSSHICEFELLGSKHVIISKYLEIFGEHPDLVGWNFLEVLHDIFQILLPYEDKYDECLEIYEIVLDQRQKYLGQNHEQTLMAEAELIMLLAIKGQRKDANKMLEKNNITELMFEDRLNPVILLKDLARVQLETDIIKKLEIVQGILDKQEEALGPEHNMCKLTLQYMRSLDSSSITNEEYCSLFPSPFAAINFAMMTNNSNLFQHVLATFSHKLENFHPFLVNQIASQGNGEHCQYLLEHLKSRCSSTDIRTTLNNLERVGNPPLVQAILSRRDLELVQLLISNGANLEFTNNTGWRPLQFAVLRERVDLVELLLAKGCQMITRTNQGNNCLNVAAKKNQGTEVVELIIKKAKETMSLEMLRKFVNDRNEIGDTPILTAALHDNLPLLKILQINSGDIFVVNEKSWGIMHCAALRSNPKMIEFGLENGMDINAIGSEGRRPIELAASTSNVEFIEFLLKKGADYWTSSSSVLQKSLNNTFDEDLFPFLLKALKLKFDQQEEEFKACVNQQDKDGDTAFMMAAYLKKNEFANLMIKDYSVDHQVKNFKGQTVFHWAASSGNLDMIPVLTTDLKMRPQEQDFRGHDALNTAINFDQTEFALQLLEIYSNEDLMIASKLSQTCLHLSCIRFNNRMVEAILKKFQTNDQMFKFLHLTDTYGLNALHYAVSGDSAKIQEHLISHGADPKFQNWGDLHWTALRDDTDEIEKILEADPAQLELRTLDQKTPLFIAVQVGHISAMSHFNEKRSDWTAKSSTKETILHASVRTMKLKVVQFCWNKIQNHPQAKSLLDFPSENGTTAFLLAVSLGQVDIMDYLHEQGCNLFARDKSDQGPMELAMRLQPQVEELIPWLLDHGFKPLETKSNLFTAMFDISSMDPPKKKVRSKTCIML